VIPEGRYDATWDGFTCKIKKPQQGLDLNATFRRAGDRNSSSWARVRIPRREPEVRAVVRFHRAPSELCGGTTFHTWSGVLLRPFEQHSDDEMDAEDLWVYQAMGKKGTEVTGYPGHLGVSRVPLSPEVRDRRNVRLDLRAPRLVLLGGRDLVADARGGITNYKYIDWFRDHAIEDDLKLFRWSEEKLGGAAHRPWKPFDHPQLGKVEIGGWDRFQAFGNPPLPRLERSSRAFRAGCCGSRSSRPSSSSCTRARPPGAVTGRLRWWSRTRAGLPSYVASAR
jgi:hypothetical protein